MSGGNKVIGKKAAIIMLDEMSKHINELKKSSTSIQRAIDNMLEDCGKGKPLQGKGFEAIEEYFNKTYKELLHDLNSVCEVLIIRNKALADAIHKSIFMETSGGVTSQADLYKEIKELNSEIQRLDRLMEVGNSSGLDLVLGFTSSKYTVFGRFRRSNEKFLHRSKWTPYVYQK